MCNLFSKVFASNKACFSAIEKEHPIDIELIKSSSLEA